MSISVVCHGCDKKYRVKDEMAGKRIKCRACGQVITIPGGSPSVTNTASLAPKQSTGAGTPKSRKSAPSYLVGLIGGSVFLGLVVGIVLLLNRSDKTSVPNTVANAQSTSVVKSEPATDAVDATPVADTQPPVLSEDGVASQEVEKPAPVTAANSSSPEHLEASSIPDVPTPAAGQEDSFTAVEPPASTASMVRKLTTGPWEWSVVSIELKDSYIQSGSPAIPNTPVTYAAKDRNHSIAIVTLRCKPNRNLTSDEKARFRETSFGKFALDYSKILHGAELPLLGSPLFYLGHVSDTADPRHLELSMCELLAIEGGGIPGFTALSKESVPELTSAFCKQGEEMNIKLLFHARGNQDLWLFFQPITGGNAIGVARLTMAIGVIDRVDYSNWPEALKWLPEVVFPANAPWKPDSTSLGIPSSSNVTSVGTVEAVAGEKSRAPTTSSIVPSGIEDPIEFTELTPDQARKFTESAEYANCMQTGNLLDNQTNQLLIDNTQEMKFREICDTLDFKNEVDRQRAVRKFIELVGLETARKIGLRFYNAHGTVQYVWPAQAQTQPHLKPDIGATSERSSQLESSPVTPLLNTEPAELTWQNDWPAFAAEVSKIIIESDPISYSALNRTFGGSSVEWKGTIKEIELGAGGDPGVVQLSMEPVEFNINNTAALQFDTLRLRPTVDEWIKWKSLSRGTAVRFRTTLKDPKLAGVGVVAMMQGIGDYAGRDSIIVWTENGELLEVNQQAPDPSSSPPAQTNTGPLSITRESNGLVIKYHVSQGPTLEQDEWPGLVVFLSRADGQILDERLVTAKDRRSGVKYQVVVNAGGTYFFTPVSAENSDALAGYRIAEHDTKAERIELGVVREIPLGLFTDLKDSAEPTTFGLRGKPSLDWEWIGDECNVSVGLVAFKTVKGEFVFQRFLGEVATKSFKINE